MAFHLSFPKFVSFGWILVGAAALHGQAIQHQISLPSHLQWCEDSQIHGLLSEINSLRAQRGLPALRTDTVGMKVAELRAVEFVNYMATHTSGSPGFDPHQDWDATAASQGYNAVSENLAYSGNGPAYVVWGLWQTPLHLAAMTSTSANVAGVSCVLSDGLPHYTYLPGVSGTANPPPVTPPPVTPPPVTPPTTGTPQLDNDQWTFLTLINQYRAQNGAGPLQVSATLQNAAQWMSLDMQAKNYVSHTDSLGRGSGQRIAAFGYNYSPWGENIAAGFSDAAGVLEGWKNACDPDGSGTCTYAHRRNMLNQSFQAIGIGKAGAYWTTDFGGVVDQVVPPSGGGGGGGGTAAPSILFFSAAPAVITAGQSTALSWSVSGATSMSIDNGVGTVSGTSVTVRPAQTTTYRLTATNAGGSSSGVATVTVQAAPPPGGGSTGSCPGPATNAFTGCYYANADLAGTPALVRADGQINFDWGGGTPNPSLPRDGFSAQWQGYFRFDSAEYVFSAITSDGMRILIDGQPILNRWRDQPVYQYTVRSSISAGTHLVTVEYYSRSGSATAILSWQKGGSTAQIPAVTSFTASPQIVRPGQQTVLSWNVSGATSVSIDNGIGTVSGSSIAVTPAQTTTYTLTAANENGSARATVTVTVATESGGSGCPAPATGAFTGCYYNNRELSGFPALTRTDAAIHFDWMNGTPATGVTPFQFSARWQGYFDFEGGSYIFHATVSDGIRILVDGELVLDRWRDQPVYMYRATKALAPGRHLITVEYYASTGWPTAHVSWQRAQ